MQVHISSFHMRLTPQLLLPLVLLPAILVSHPTAARHVSLPSHFRQYYQNVSLPSHCRRTCGNISVPYPFGIDRGCSRPGFNLTCVYQYRRAAPAQLYLNDGAFEVTEIDVQQSRVRAKLPVYTMDLAVDSMSFPLSDALPRRWPYAIYTSSSVVVHGCNVVASIVDLANNNAVINHCDTFCLEFDSSQSVTYCEISIYDNILPPLPSFVVQLTRIKRMEKLPLRNSTSIKAFVSGDFEPSDDLILQVVTSNITHVEVWFSWYMGDYASCDVASKDPNKTYACLSEFSYCNQLDTYNGRSAGYKCSCNDNYNGNPYQRNGCSPSLTATDIVKTLSPTANCSRKCGTVDIPFPFGIENRCYRGESFALVCNTTHNPPDLSFRDWYNISEILLDEGQLRIPKPFVSSTYPFTFFANQLASWVIDEQTCAVANKSLNFACVAANSVCLDNTNRSEGAAAGYRCKCKDGYRGNPYLEGGCKDIDECKLPSKCYGHCINTNGNFTCTCQPGTVGDPLLGPCIPNKKKNLVLGGIIIGASTGIGILLLSIVVVITIRTWKTRKQIKAKEKHFRQNHGLLLQQLISSSESTAERTRIFSLEEIEKATNNFDETRVVGRGGHGIVYKGILSDQRVVAIKRSKHMKQSEIDQFINEVAILSQINHRNVVKLFGCCLETQVPLLIYEFISNGTLSDHLHVPNGKSTLSWDDRLRIAAEAAGSLAYLHSAASISIFHRDVKSSNILLDDHFVAKVSDFGASRFIPLDQTHVVTAIQGTFGYLDPEYYQTSQLTEKSDVYSFGVILLELLTGKKPIYLAEGDATVNLSMQFLQAVRQNRCFDLVEDGIMEGGEEELGEIIHLIEMCLRLKGVERPTMKEVECKLQELRRIRMKKRGYCTGEGNAGDQYFPTASCYPRVSVDQTSQGATRSYSLEKELMWSHYYPR